MIKFCSIFLCNGSALPKSGSALPGFGSALPKFGSALPRFGSALPKSGSAFPKSGSALPKFGSALPGFGSALPVLRAGPTIIEKSMEEKAEILENVLHQYITGVATHFRGKVAAWDVVNEPMNDNGTLRSGEENLQATDVFYWQCKLIRQEAVLKVGLNAKDAKKPQRTQSLYR